MKNTSDTLTNAKDVDYISGEILEKVIDDRTA
jgi:hypothetical protein